MLFPPRRELLRDQQFLKGHNITVGKRATKDALGSILEELAENFGVSDHPVVPMIERHALRDTYLQGVRDTINAFLNFSVIPADKQLADYDWMAPEDEEDEKEE